METKDLCLLIKQNQIRGKIFYPEKFEKKSAGIIFLCHGIPGGEKDSNDPGYESLARTLTAQEYITVVFNFRGAGESSGDFDLRGWAEDLRAVVDFVSPVGNTSLPVILFGFSAGAAVAIYAFAHNDSRIKGLILCGCPANF
ncbi:MAG: lysophospholipase, partial [Desulfobacterota bacterium]|nr:lysophospholipase [Thermodesulfobacteriota bacterium]